MVQSFRASRPWREPAVDFQRVPFGIDPLELGWRGTLQCWCGGHAVICQCHPGRSWPGSRSAVNSSLSCHHRAHSSHSDLPGASISSCRRTMWVFALLFLPGMVPLPRSQRFIQCFPDIPGTFLPLCLQLPAVPTSYGR